MGCIGGLKRRVLVRRLQCPLTQARIESGTPALDLRTTSLITNHVKPYWGQRSNVSRIAIASSMSVCPAFRRCLGNKNGFLDTHRGLREYGRMTCYCWDAETPTQDKSDPRPLRRINATNEGSAGNLRTVRQTRETSGVLDCPRSVVGW